MKKAHPFIRCRRGFTLVEIMVVIAIIAVLATLIFSISGKMLLKAEKVACTSLVRNFSVAIISYESEHNRMPLPDHKYKDWDTILGDKNGNYSTEPLVKVLIGSDDLTWTENTGDTFDMRNLNPQGSVYLEANISYSKKEGGLKEDGKLYDPWGNELMFAFNSRIQQDDIGSPIGKQDEILHTWGLAEWAETKPGYDQFVIWSYGDDGIKGRGDKATFAGSDDVKSF